MHQESMHVFYPVPAVILRLNASRFQLDRLYQITELKGKTTDRRRQREPKASEAVGSINVEMGPKYNYQEYM